MSVPAPARVASGKRSLDDDSTAAASSSSVSSPPTLQASTPRKKQRTAATGVCALPTPSPQKNSPFPPSALASSSSSSSSTSPTKRVTFDPALPPISPHTTPKKQFQASLLFPAPSPSSSSLPPALHSLFLLHTALSVTLSLHLATKPPNPPPRTQENKAKNPLGFEAEDVEFKAVANYEGQSGLRELVENGAGRRFPIEDLRRLFWLYEWDGNALPPSTTTSRTLTPGRVVPPTATTTKPTAPSLLSLTLTPTRTLSKSTGKETHTYAFNLTVPHSPHLGGVVGAVGRWSAKQGERSTEVRRRLDRWVSLCQADEAKFGDGGSAADLPTAKMVKSLPMKVLTPLPGAATGPGGGMVSAGRSATSVSLANAPPSTMRRNLLAANPPTSTLSPSPKRILSFGADQTPAAPNTPPATPTKGAAAGGATTPLSSSSVAAKRQSMRERMLAKEAASSSSGNHGAFLQTPLGLGLGLGDAFIDASVQRGRQAASRKLLDRDELKRRSILSRLGNVAEGVFLLFTASSSSSCSLTSSSASGLPPSPSSAAKRRALPLSEVAQVVLKSSKTEISLAEARESLTLLTTLCPFFLRSLMLGGEAYLEMPATTTTTTTTPSSPMAPASPSNQKFGGPASPGKVLSLSRGGGAGGGGLREVRERIRRELGE